MILSNKKEVKRLAIYFFYDKDGIVDDYVLHMLNDLNKNISDLLVVCNGLLTIDGRHKLEKCTKNILVRPNTGFDVWAYKEALESYGWDGLSEFDEVILMNFTIMGPLYPFEEMFSNMNKKDIDFWGITAFHKAEFDPFGTIKYGYIPLHIQSHFIVVRQNMLKSSDFQKYWNERPMVNSYEEAIGFHEAIFTKEFGDKGYKWDVYADTSDLYNHSYCPIIMSPLKLIKDKRCPIIKRRSFFHDYNDFLNFNTGEASVKMMEYIEKNLDYDTNLIWDNILRVQNQADIKRNLHLNYILSSEVTETTKNKNKNKKIALIMHIYFEDLVEYCFNYAASMPKYSDIYITTNSKEKKYIIEKIFKKGNFNKVEVIIIENRGRDVSALLVATKKFIMEYDYVCFAHDKKVGQLDFAIKGEAFSNKCFENILSNNIFVENIINTFEKNPRLGLLTPPPPNHAEYYPTIGEMDWGCNYMNTLNLAKDLDINLNFNYDKEPIAPLGTMFWFRPQALKTLFDKNWEYNDFPKEPNDTDGTLLHAIERIYPFVVQHEGYYPAWVMVDSFAQIEITNLYFMLRELNRVAFRLYGCNTHSNLVSTMKYSLMQNQDNGTMQIDIMLKHLLKEKIKRKVPKNIWNKIKKVYFFFKRRA